MDARHGTFTFSLVRETLTSFYVFFFFHPAYVLSQRMDPYAISLPLTATVEPWWRLMPKNPALTACRTVSSWSSGSKPPGGICLSQLRWKKRGTGTCTCFCGLYLRLPVNSVEFKLDSIQRSQISFFYIIFRSQVERSPSLSLPRCAQLRHRARLQQRPTNGRQQRLHRISAVLWNQGQVSLIRARRWSMRAY